MTRHQMKCEICNQAKKFIEETKRNGRKIDEMNLIYYLSGYYKNTKIYLYDLLEIVRNLMEKEGETI